MEAQPAALVRADLIPHLGVPGVTCWQELLRFGKLVEKGEAGAGRIGTRGQLGLHWALRILKVMLEAAKRSHSTCCFVMGGSKSECPLLSKVFLQVGCRER